LEKQAVRRLNLAKHDQFTEKQGIAPAFVFALLRGSITQATPLVCSVAR
jgi:hypothetical protein